VIHDPRLTLARPDLAAAALEGRIRADRFAETTRMRLIIPAAAVRTAPRFDAEQVDQLLFGESFQVIDVTDGFAWGQADRDGYVGWVEAAALSPRLLEPTHRVRAVRTFAFAEPSIKSPARGPFSLNALLKVTETEGALAFVEGAGWIARAHLMEIGAAFEDATDVAERFLGTPYLWGGRDSLGLDCSGLVQQAFYAAGLTCPRDTDLQAALGEPIAAGALARGDLVFWRGHVGIMLDAERLLHANAHHMAVVVEPLAGATDRIAGAGGGTPSAHRRVRPSGL
jgi:cell wall-associated NlpC family hydrolase